MDYWQCPQCGNHLQGYETSCPWCGIPLQPSQNYSSANYQIQDEGDNQAEDILRKWLNLTKWIILVISFVISASEVLSGFLMAISYFKVLWWYFFVGVLSGALTVLIGWALSRLVWSIGMVFINISTNVRKIKHLMERRF